VNLLNQKYNFFLTNALAGTGLTTNDYLTLYNKVLQSNAVFNSMYSFLQQTVASNWAITFGSYSPQFYLNLSNSLFLQNSCNLTGYSANQYINTVGVSNLTTNTVIPTDSPNYWPGLSRDTRPDNLLSNLFSTGFSYIGNEIINEQLFTDSNGYLNINVVNRSIDIEANIFPGSYTYFKFRSPVKQNLQVETLPRPLGYRYTNYNSKYSENTQQYFDLSYSFLENTSNLGMNNIDASKLLEISVAESTDGLINTLKPIKYYKYTSGNPLAVGASLVKFPVTVTITSSKADFFEDSFQLFMYHDLGVFNADVLKVRQENPKHYKYNVSGSTTNSQVTLTFNAVNANNYYFILRSTEKRFNIINYRISVAESTNLTPIYNNLTNFDPYANPASDPTNYNYAILYDPDILKLPSYSNLFNREPFDPLLPSSAPPIGIDALDRSDDLTDYRPSIDGTSLIPTSVKLDNTGIDPLNSFTFHYVLPYNSSLQTYIYNSNGEEYVVLDNNYNIYNVSTIERDYKIVQWYSQNYIPKQVNDSFYSGLFGTASSFTKTLIDIPNYSYNVNNEIQLGSGIVGFTFLPSDGIWNLEEMWFKSALVPSTPEEDPNNSIQYMGIFYTVDIYQKAIPTINLEDAVCILNRASTITYSKGSDIDQIGGTYYQFLIEKEKTDIYGYTQNFSTILNNPFNLYCAIAFTAASSIQTISYLAGTTVPYPEFSAPSTSSNYFGIVPPKPAIYLDNPYLIIPSTTISSDPNKGPPPNSIYYSQYEQSIPIVTTGIQYLSKKDFIKNDTGLIPFQTSIANANADAYSFYLRDKIIINKEYLQAWQYEDNSAQYTFTLDTLFSPENSENFITFCTAQSNIYLFGAKGSDIIIKGFDEATGQIQNINISTPNLLSSELVQKFFMRENNESTQYVYSTYDYVTSTSRYYINKNAYGQQATAISSFDGGHDMWCDPSSNNI
jgi:hypothetical protein